MSIAKIKSLCTLVLAVVLTFFISACGGSSGGGGQPQAEGTQKPTIVTLKVKNQNNVNSVKKGGDLNSTISEVTGLSKGTGVKHQNVLSAPIPSQIGSITLEVKIPDCTSAVVYTNTTDVSGDSPTYSFELSSGSTGCFIAYAYSGTGGTGTLLFEGSVSGVLLPAGGTINVSVPLGLVGVTPPTVTTNSPSNITPNSAIFEGTVNPNSFETGAYFEWGLTTSYGSATPIQQVGSGNTDVAVSQQVSGLEQATYHYRLVAYDSGNIVYGSDMQFSTMTQSGVALDIPPLTAPAVTTASATSITGDGATLNGTVNPNGSASGYYFEWGTDTTYGNTTSLTEIASSTTDVSVNAAFTGLTTGTTYHFRLVAYNAGGLTVGEDQSFTAGSGGTTSGKVWTWGSNGSGQLGDGTTTGRYTPAEVSGITNIIKIATGNAHSLALKNDGTLWAWGANYYGQLGDGTSGAGSDRYTPVQVGGLTGVIDMAGGNYHTVALKNDGTVWTWGNGSNGQLGDGSFTQAMTTPFQVSGLTNVIIVNAGMWYTLALKNDGTIWAWGYNAHGQLGDGTITQRLYPVQVSGLTGVIDIKAGGEHTLALKNDGTIWAWGYNSSGQLGDGTTTDRYTPVQVSGLTDITAIATGNGYSMAVKNDGTLWAWGANSDGQLGDGTTIDKYTPVQVSGITNVIVADGSGSKTIALKNDGTVWEWGTSWIGYIPVQTGGIDGVTAIAMGEGHSIALK